MLSEVESLQTDRIGKRKRERERWAALRCLFPINNNRENSVYVYIFFSTKCVLRTREWLTVELSRRRRREIFLRTSCQGIYT